MDEVKNQEEVAEDSTPETTEQEVEQREDDYQGLVRRLDDVLERVDKVLEVVERVEAMSAGFVEAGATVREGVDDISEDVIEDTGINDVIDEVIEEVVDIDDLDLAL